MAYIANFPFSSGDNILHKVVEVGIQYKQKLTNKIEAMIFRASKYAGRKFQENFLSLVSEFIDIFAPNWEKALRWMLHLWRLSSEF